MTERGRLAGASFSFLEATALEADQTEKSRCSHHQLLLRLHTSWPTQLQTTSSRASGSPSSSRSSAGVLSLLWGLVLAVLRQLPGAPLAPVRWATIAYIDVFRGIPLLLVLLLVSAVPLGAPIEGEIPKRDRHPDLVRRRRRPSGTGSWHLTLTYGAYMAEVYRAGIEAVPRGQMEAARSLGMSHGQAMRYVIVPQAVRKVIPPLLNDFIALMKDTSLVSILGARRGRSGRAATSRPSRSTASGLMLGAMMFLVVTIPLARVVDWLIGREQKRPHAAALTEAGCRLVAESTAGGGAAAGL